MAHEIENMFFVGETPWHGLGTRIEGRPTSEEAIVAAGLDWQVGLKDLQIAEGGAPVSHKAVVRATDGAVLGVVGPSWTPLQNTEAFRFFDPLVADGKAAYETAGSLRAGQRVWILAELMLAPSEIVPGDLVKHYALLSNSHDGSLAVRVGFTDVRVVCANTLQMAHGAETSKLLRLRHTKNVGEALERVREVMDLAQRSFASTAEQYRALARRGAVEADLRRYVDLVFRPAQTALKDKVAEAAAVAGVSPETAEEANRERIYPRIVELFEAGRGTEIPGVRGTLWGAYNAVTEYVAHERGNDDAKRLDQTWFGAGAKINARALEVALQMAA